MYLLVSIIHQSSMIILVALRGVSEGGDSPPSGNKKIFVFVVGVVLVVLNS